ncbi:MAG: VCBS repeat-containing protein, partial [Candidatus Delongbacteria bacterium]|nr:VCBS repeat-containing protein [Candidatus Delongbacteria bacterium]MCG2760307.1 FG-GAP-like repeat-containing protein [Candidatus Delongbacteria bacterium]
VFCGYQENIFLQKINNDEYLDIVTFYSDFSSGSADRYVRIIGNDNGQFEMYQDFPLNSDKIFSGMNYGDIDGDGDIDIVFYSNSGYFWGYMKNDGTGQFSSPIYYDLDEPPGAIACGDLTGNGKEEILVGSGTKITIYNSVSGVSELTHDALGGVNEMAIEDINNDGINEIIACNWYTPGTQKLLLIFSCTGDAITLMYSKYLDEALASFFIEDLNGDGYLDVIYNSSYYYPNSDYEKWHTYILFNEAGSTLAGPVNYQTYFGDTPNYTSTIRSFVADIDGNGLNDIVSLNSSYAYENDVTILFQTEAGDFVQDPQTGIENQDNLISKVELYQNYPNPFNNETIIRFSLDAPSEVKLNIHNGKGELVESIVQSRYAQGIHSVNYRTDDLTSGVYYYELKVNGIHRQVRKMLYLR